MYIDEQLTINMQGWLNTEPAKRDLMKGAEMILKLTRNRILYQNISHNPQKFASKIEYELKNTRPSAWTERRFKTWSRWTKSWFRP